MRLALALCLIAPAALAETPMSPSDFEAWSSGKTLDYFIDGLLWGSEQHLPGRQTLDADAEGPCNRGKWAAQGDQICFSYDVSPGPHCWTFFKDGDKVIALLADDPLSPLYEVRPRATPLACPGPDVGV